MNKIYKVMYSKVKQCCVVVSEIAKSHGRHTKRSVAKSSAALTAGVLIALGSFSFVGMPVAQAADGTESMKNNDYVGANGYYWYLDEKTNQWKKYPYKISSLNNNRSWQELPNYEGGGAKEPGAVTAGLYAQAGEQTVTIGNRNAGQSKGSVFIGELDGYNNGGKNDPVGMRNNYVTAVGFQSNATGWGSIAIGSNAVAENTQETSQVVDYEGNAGTSGTVQDDNYGIKLKPSITWSSVALGYSAKAKDGNIAIGANSDATSTDKGDSYVSVGNGTLKRRITNVAKGTDNSDVVTVGQMNDAIAQTGGSVKAGWGITKSNDNTISVKHNLSTGDSAYAAVAYADSEATGLILGGSIQDRNADEKYGATTETSVIVGARNALASNDNTVVIGGDNNIASRRGSTVVGGSSNTASGQGYSEAASVFGGSFNISNGLASVVLGGFGNVANNDYSTNSGGAKNVVFGLGSNNSGGLKNVVYASDNASSFGGVAAAVNGQYSTGVAGGSTGSNARLSFAAGFQSLVTDSGVRKTVITRDEYERKWSEQTREFGPVQAGFNPITNKYEQDDKISTALGYQATADEPGTIAFGHDAGDESGYTYEWETLTDEKGNPKQNEIDGTTNDYTKAPKSVKKKAPYTSAYYNRLVKAADGIEDHDAVVMEQLKNASGVGSKIKIYQTDENGNIKFDENNNPIEDTSDSDAVKTKRETAREASKDAWGQALGAGTFTTGTPDKATDASTSDQLITGKTLYDYDKPTASQNYVNVNNTTGQNLSALDAQVKANADALTKPNHNIKYYSVTAGPSLGYDQYTNENNDGAKGTASLAAGNVTHTDGAASTVVGSYSAVFGTGLQGAAALSYGTVNVNNNTDTTKEFSGVANSIVGQANVTTDSNAAIIYGAGNTVKNSYRDIDKEKAKAILNSTGNAEQLQKALQDAIPTSGGQVMVMGGGNSVENAYMTQVTGVGNKVTGTQTWSDEEKADNSGVTQLNFIDGFYSSLENGHNDYMIGAYNKLKDSDSTIIFGDNNGQKFFASSNDSKPQKDNINFVNVKDSIAIGSNNNFISKADKAHGSLEDVVAVGNNNTVRGSSHAIAIGDQNTIHNGEAWQGDPKSINSSGNVAIGYNTKIWYDATYGSDGESIVIGKNASAYNPVGTLEKTFNFGNEDLKNQKSGFTGSIAIGENAFARSGSTTIGVHRYKGTLGDINVDPTSTPSGYSGNNGVGNSMLSSNATTVGNETYNNGVFSTAMGSYTSLSGLYSHQKWGEKYYGLQNFGAAVIGSLDSVESLTSTQGTAGMADSILGSANRTQNANGTVMVGAGNVVTNSAVEFGADEIKTAGSENPNKLSEAMRTSIRNAKGGGAASVIGNGNIVDSSTSVSVVGAKNEVYNTKNAQIFASNRTIGTKTPDTTSTGDATIEVKPVENSVIIGSASVDSPVTTTKSNVTILGYNANAEVDGGVAIGSGSVASTAAGVAGYDPTGATAGTTPAWTSKKAAVSVGTADETRQLTGLAAGTNDTDAVNVAQLRKLGDNTVQYDLNTKKGKITLAGKDGTTITNVKSALVGAKDANGKDATISTATGADLSNAVNLKDLQDVYNEVNSKADKANSSHTALTVEGGNAAGTEEGSYTGDNILLHATTDATTGKVTYDLKLNNDIMIGNKGKDGVSITGPQGEAGKDGIDGKVGISGKDGKDAVSISGKDGVGHIGLTGPAGTNGMDSADGKPGNSIDITVKNGYNVKGKDGKDGINGENGVDGTSLTRIVYKDATGEHQIATLEDGLKFKGDDTTVINKKLNNTLDIIGGAKGDLTEGNIGVNSTTDGKLKVQLAKELTDITSISNQKTEGGKTTGAKITLGDDGSVDVNGGKITNVGSGIEKDENNKYTVTEQNQGNAANIGDVQNMVNEAVNSAADTTNKALAGKANIDASNIGANLKHADGSVASADDQKANAEKWGSAIGTGEIKADDGRMVTGKTVYDEVRPTEDGNYVKKDETTGKNLSALDSKIGKLDANGNYIQKDASVSSNLNTLDTHVKANADAISKEKQAREAAITNITNNIGNLSDSAVKYDANTNKTKITLAGEGGTTITNLKDGALSDSSTDAVNGKQLYNEQQDREKADAEINQKVKNNTKEITEINNGNFTDASKTAIHNIAKDAVKVVDGENTKVTKIDGTNTTPTTYAVNVEGNGKVDSGDTGLISGGTLYNEVHVDKDGTYIKSKDSATGKDMTVAQNLSALDSGLKTTSDLIHTNTAGDTIQIGGSSTATKIDVNGKDGKGRVITGVVSDANDPTSAANVGYVNGLTAANTQQIYRDMNNAYGRLNDNINKAAAGSNALAALHPLDYDPDDKADFAVGYGHYRNANAAAVGAFYHPNENTMVNVGVSLGNGDPGFNAGVSFKVGRGGAGREAMSKTEMAKVINSQSKEIDALKKDNADKDKRIDALEQKMAEILAKLDKNGK